MQQIFSSRFLFTGKEVLHDQLVVVDDGIITDISPIAAMKKKPSYTGHYITPSFIDLQIYGARGKLFSVNPSADTLQGMYEHCLEGGTNHFLVTIATNTEEVVRSAIDAVKKYWQKGGKGLLGLHLEGPWINPLKRGAHIEAYIKVPQVEDVKLILEYGRGVIKMITLAPEVCNEEVIDLIQSFDIIISAGHSNATFAEGTEAFRKGIASVTHLYNAMSPFQHRETGLPGAAFNHASVMASIIADGYHVDFNAIKIAKKLMNDRLFLITDAVTKTSEGPYQHAYYEGRYVCGNTLSGSALTMLEAVKNCINHCDIPVEEAFKMASLYPAQLMNMKEGTIALGANASFLLLDKNLNLVARS